MILKLFLSINLMRIGNWSEMFMKFLLVPQYNISPIDYSSEKYISKNHILWYILRERVREKKSKMAPKIPKLNFFLQ